MYLNGLIKIAGLEMKTLKRWNDEYPFSNEVNDGRFLAALLDVVFDRRTMSRSSLYGKPANNGGHIHDALNPAIMEFVKGTHLPFVSSECYVNVKRFYFLIILYIDVFNERIGNMNKDQRLKKFKNYISKKCINSRRRRA